MLAKDVSCSASRVDDDDGDIAQLDLVHLAKLLGPLSVLVGGVDANVPKVPNDRQARGTFHVADSSIVADDLIDEEVDDGGEHYRNQDRFARALANVVVQRQQKACDGHSCDTRMNKA